MIRQPPPPHEPDFLGPRLVDLAPKGQSARFLSAVGPHRQVSTETLARLEHRIVGRLERQPRHRGIKWWALISLGVAGAAGATTVASRVFDFPIFERLLQKGSVENPVRRRAVRTVAVAPPGPQITPISTPVPVVVPPELPDRVAAPRPEPGRVRTKFKVEAVPRPAAVVAAAPAVEPPPSGLAAESALLETALRHLRKDRDGARALAALDDYRRQFPSGELVHEAQRTRVEAFLLQGQSRSALDMLDGMTFGGSVRDLDLLVMRAELRAEGSRCPEAIMDFTAVLAHAGVGDRAAERALFGRASCRSRTSDQPGARSDLDLYLRRFPEGKRAAQARSALSR